MSQNAELAKVKLRIKAYLERTTDRGFTENEALIAAQKLGELIEQYDINLSELDLAEENCVHKKFTIPGHNLNSLGSILVGVGKLTNSKVWYTRGFDQNFKDVLYYNFFGLESDTDVAVYLADTLNRALNSETEAFKKTSTYKDSHLPKRSVSTSFQRGFAARVYARLVELTKQNDELLKRDAEKRTVQTGVECRSLVVVKQDKVEAEFAAKFGWKLGGGRSNHTVRDSSAYQAGRAAGDRANLNRPIGGKSVVYIGDIGRK